MTVKFNELLAWPATETTIGTFLGNPVQDAPVAGSFCGTVNWMETAD